MAFTAPFCIRPDPDEDDFSDHRYLLRFMTHEDEKQGGSLVRQDDGRWAPRANREALARVLGVSSFTDRAVKNDLEAKSAIERGRMKSKVGRSFACQRAPLICQRCPVPFPVPNRS